MAVTTMPAEVTRELRELEAAIAAAPRTCEACGCKRRAAEEVDLGDARYQLCTPCARFVRDNG